TCGARGPGETRGDRHARRPHHFGSGTLGVAGRRQALRIKVPSCPFPACHMRFSLIGGRLRSDAPDQRIECLLLTSSLTHLIAPPAPSRASSPPSSSS